jgi:hypothetical protein
MEGRVNLNQSLNYLVELVEGTKRCLGFIFENGWFCVLAYLEVSQANLVHQLKHLC